MTTTHQKRYPADLRAKAVAFAIEHNRRTGRGGATAATVLRRMADVRERLAAVEAEAVALRAEYEELKKAR